LTLFLKSRSEARDPYTERDLKDDMIVAARLSLLYGSLTGKTRWFGISEKSIYDLSL